jgi:hypothetical protein
MGVESRLLSQRPSIFEAKDAPIPDVTPAANEFSEPEPKKQTSRFEDAFCIKHPSLSLVTL